VESLLCSAAILRARVSSTGEIDDMGLLDAALVANPLLIEDRNKHLNIPYHEANLKNSWLEHG
jgi:hypothetical protein